jgi:predicted small integral membrane protein
LVVGFSRIFLLGILIYKELTARRLYKSFGVEGLINQSWLHHHSVRFWWTCLLTLQILPVVTSVKRLAFRNKFLINYSSTAKNVGAQNIYKLTIFDSEIFSHSKQESHQSLISLHSIVTESALPMQISRFFTTSFFLFCLAVVDFYAPPTGNSIRSCVAHAGRLC